MTATAGKAHPNARTLASLYFAPAPDSFWRWSDTFDSVTSREGSTIAFYQEIVAVLRVLVPSGLPAFDAVVLFLAACRDDPQAGQGLINECLQHLLAGDRVSGSGPDTSALRQALQRFHFLSASRRTSLNGKVTLAAMLFEDPPHVLSGDDAAHVTAHLEQRALRTVGTRTASGARMAHALTDLLQRVTAIDWNSLELRLRTGLDAGVREAPVADAPGFIRARQLLRELRDEDEGELRGLARIALDLMAVVHIPRAIDEPELLPLGGYSDISNRGKPDRLLLTELAQDDDVLAARVTLNEALYLRRETPPRTPQRERNIVIDTGIRMWGIPRVYATSLALALVATAGTRLPSRVFRVATGGTGAEPVDLFTREGLTAQLEALATDPHPGHALRAVADLQGTGRSADIILVTHPRTLADDHFQRMLGKLSLAGLYVATVDAAGHYELWQLSPRGRRLLQRAKCPLDAILNPAARTPASLLNPDIADDLPLALRMREFPLLTAQPLTSEHASYHADCGLAAYLRDGRVVLWEKPHFGARILHCPAHRTQAAWLWIDDRHKEVLLVHEADADRPPFLTRIPLQGGAPTELALDIPHENDHPSFAFHPGGHLLCLHQRCQLSLFSPQSGQREGTLTLERPGRLIGRYVQDAANAWHVITWQNGRLASEPVPATALPKSAIVRCFDRLRHEGTHVVLANGSIFRLSPAPSLVHKMPHGVASVRMISRDGSRLLYADSGGDARLLDLDAGRFDSIPPRARHPLQLVEKNLGPFHRRAPALRKNFRAISLTREGELCLTTRNHQLMLLRHSPTRGMLHLQPATQSLARGDETAFERIPSPFGEHHLLDRADFPDGTRCYLDGRGFLHVQPADPGLAQATIVLKDGMLSGWFSDGTWFGDRYFIGDHTVTDSASAYDRLMHAVQNLGSSVRR